MAARGLPVVIVNPAHVLGRGDLYRSSTELVRRFLTRRSPPTWTARSTSSTCGTWPPAHLAADERGAAGRALHPGQPQLHAGPPVRRPGPAVGRRAAGAEAAGGGRGGAGAAPASRSPARRRITAGEVRAAAMWWTYRNTKARRELGFRPSPHEETLEAHDRLVPRARGQPPGLGRGPSAAGAAGGGPGAARRRRRRRRGWRHRSWPPSTAAPTPPTGCAPAARSAAPCAATASSTSRSACPCAGAGARRSRR